VLGGFDAEVINFACLGSETQRSRYLGLRFEPRLPAGAKRMIAWSHLKEEVGPKVFCAHPSSIDADSGGHGADVGRNIVYIFVPEHIHQGLAWFGLAGGMRLLVHPHIEIDFVGPQPAAIRALASSSCAKIGDAKRRTTKRALFIMAASGAKDFLEI
jgi:hypothetical protein